VRDLKMAKEAAMDPEFGVLGSVLYTPIIAWHPFIQGDSL